MDILNVLVRLRDDIKTWVTNNINILNIKIENKVNKVEGKGLSTNDFTNDYKNKLDNFNESGGNLFEETDPTVPAWAKEANKPTYTAHEVGALPADTVIPSIEGLAAESYVDNKVASKQDAITGTAGQFVVIGANGKPTTKTLLNAEEATF